MKRKILLFLSGFVVILFVGVATKRNTEIEEIKKENYAQVFSTEISGVLTNSSGTMLQQANKVLVNSDAKEIKRWGIRRNKNNELPFADPGAPELLKKYNSFYVGDTRKKVIYLTFDEGYENGYTGNILDTLKRENVKAVFFITGPYIKEHMQLVERMVHEGHVVGNHTVNHPSLPTLDDKRIRDELRELDYVYYEKFKKHMKFFRAPKGEYNERTLGITKDMGYINLFWSLAYDDWYVNKVRGKDYAHDIVTNNLHNGAIILLHAVSKDNAEALPYIIKTAREKGFEFGDCELDFPDNIPK